MPRSPITRAYDEWASRWHDEDLAWNPPQVQVDRQHLWLWRSLVFFSWCKNYDSAWSMESLPSCFKLTTLNMDFPCFFLKWHPNKNSFQDSSSPMSVEVRTWKKDRTLAAMIGSRDYMEINVASYIHILLVGATYIWTKIRRQLYSWYRMVVFTWNLPWFLIELPKVCC